MEECTKIAFFCSNFASEYIRERPTYMYLYIITFIMMKETSKKYIAKMSCNEMNHTEGGYTLPEVVVVGSKKNFENNVGEVYRDLGTDAAIGLVLNYCYYNFLVF